MTDAPTGAERPPFVHPVAPMPPGYRTHASLQEALGLTPEQWREMQAKLAADLRAIDENRRQALQAAANVWLD